MTRDDLVAALTNDNVVAFLRLIREGESSQDDSAYTVMFGGKHFESFADHPRIVNKAAGLESSAAGAYQFLARTWDGLVAKYHFPDFSPISQDCGAVALIAGRGALDDVIAGRLDEAIRKCGKEWASLPGAGYNQPEQKIQKAREVFEAYGGKSGETSQPVPSTPPAQPAQTKEVKPMGFLAALIPSLLQAAPDLIRLIGGGEQSQKNAAVVEKVAQVAMDVTGAVNEQDAAEKLKDEAMAAKFREAVHENMDQWLGMMVKLQAMEEDSRAKAREFAVTYGRDPVIGKLTFIELLSLLMLLISSVGGGYVLVTDFPAEIKGAVITLMLIGGYTGVKEFWLGSSMGSMRKDDRAAK